MWCKGKYGAKNSSRESKCGVTDSLGRSKLGAKDISLQSKCVVEVNVVRR